jgi:hypothetical protein
MQCPLAACHHAFAYALTSKTLLEMRVERRIAQVPFAASTEEVPILQVVSCPAFCLLRFRWATVPPSFLFPLHMRTQCILIIEFIFSQNHLLLLPVNRTLFWLHKLKPSFTHPFRSIQLSLERVHLFAVNLTTEYRTPNNFLWLFCNYHGFLFHCLAFDRTPSIITLLNLRKRKELHWKSSCFELMTHILLCWLKSCDCSLFLLVPRFIITLYLVQRFPNSLIWEFLSSSYSLKL